MQVIIIKVCRFSYYFILALFVYILIIAAANYTAMSVRAFVNAETLALGK